MTARELEIRNALNDAYHPFSIMGEDIKEIYLAAYTQAIEAMMLRRDAEIEAALAKVEEEAKERATCIGRNSYDQTCYEEQASGLREAMSIIRDHLKLPK